MGRTMQVATKFARLAKPAALGDRIDGWCVAWVGGWDRCRVLFVVMGRKARAARSKSALSFPAAVSLSSELAGRSPAFRRGFEKNVGDVLSGRYEEAVRNARRNVNDLACR